jgi:hypothetical protein
LVRGLERALAAQLLDPGVATATDLVTVNIDNMRRVCGDGHRVRASECKPPLTLTSLIFNEVVGLPLFQLGIDKRDGHRAPALNGI